MGVDGSVTSDYRRAKPKAGDLTARYVIRHQWSTRDYLFTFITQLQLLVNNEINMKTLLRVLCTARMPIIKPVSSDLSFVGYETFCLSVQLAFGWFLKCQEHCNCRVRT